MGVRYIESRVKANTGSFLEGYFHSLMYLVVFPTPFVFLALGWVLSLAFFISNLLIFLILRSWASRSSSVHELIPQSQSSAITAGFVINLVFALLIVFVLTTIRFSFVI